MTTALTQVCCNMETEQPEPDWRLASEWPWLYRRIGSGYDARVYVESDPDNPREIVEPVSQIVSWHRRYTIGDEHQWATPEDFLESVQWSLGEDSDAVLKPLYAYEHGGIALSTGQFSCPWDSGQVGFLYVPPGVMQEESWNMEQLDAYVKQELKDLQAYINGEVYQMGIHHSHNPTPQMTGDFGEIDPIYAIYDTSDAMLEEYMQDLVKTCLPDYFTIAAGEWIQPKVPNHRN